MSNLPKTPGGSANAAWRPSLQEVSTASALLRTVQVLAERIDHLHLTTWNQEQQSQVIGGAVAKLTPKNIQQALSAHGAAPLDLTALTGRAYAPQLAFVPAYSGMPNQQDPSSQGGALISLNGVLYRYNVGAVPGTGTFPGQFLPQGSTAVLLEDTHANRVANFVASSYPIGAAFYETDRQILYINLGTYGTSNWTYATGIMIGATGALPGDLGVHDVDFLFLDTTLKTLEYWNGAAWITVLGIITGVTSLDSITGAIVLVQGPGITISNGVPGAQNITISVTSPGAWTPYTPAVSVPGGATAVVTNIFAGYIQEFAGKTVDVRAFATVNITGATSIVRFSLPTGFVVNAGTTGQVFACSIYNQSTGLPITNTFCAFIDSAPGVRVQSSANLPAGVNLDITFQGPYEST